MKKITLLMVALLLGITGVSAKTKTTTLWEETYTGGNIEIPVANLVSGATITVFTTVKSSDTEDYRKLRIFYTAAGDGWTQTSFEDVSDWVELTAGQEFYSFTLTSSAYSILSDDTKSHKILYIGANNKEYLTITKITQTETLEPTTTGDNLLSENWIANWDGKMFAAQSSAKIGDVIRFSYSAPGEWSYFQFNILDAYGNADAFENKSSNVGTSIATAADLYFDFEITNISDLKKIQNEGFGIKGNNFTLTSVQLLTYSDSYGYITITIPEVGYATWSSDKKYDFKSAGLQAYYASDVATGSVTLTPMDITWDWQGYIIKGSAGEHDVLESLTTDGSYYPSTNYLKYNIDAAEVYDSGKNRYIFAVKNDDASSVGFYKLTSEYTLAAHKAYLETETDITPTESRVALIFDDGETTGIQELENSSIEELNHSGNETLKAYYNLNGQRVTNPKRGLYIVNGKKVIIK